MVEYDISLDHDFVLYDEQTVNVSEDLPLSTRAYSGCW